MMTEEWKNELSQIGYDEEDLYESAKMIFKIQIPRVSVYGDYVEETKLRKISEEIDAYVKARLKRFTSVGLAEYIREIEDSFGVLMGISEEDAYRLLKHFTLFMRTRNKGK